jgi:hypothetical protein
LSGIVHLGYVHQVTFLDAFEKAFPIRLLDFPKAILKADLYPYVHCAVESMRGFASAQKWNCPDISTP